MELNTRFGTQSVDPQTLINFPDGLPGFDELKQFKLFHEEGKPTVFFLQAVDDETVQFSLVDPDMFQVNYQVTLQQDEIAKLELEDANDATILVTVAKTEEEMDGGIRANFMGPIVINTRQRIGMQKALNRVSGSVVIVAD